jgi:4-azaleucine resistance transporter AzlC
MPIGLAFGVIAQKAGLSPFEIGGMSLLVFAGSSQFIGVSMLSSGAGFFSIALATFTINLRHLLMSSALAVFLKGVSRSWLTLFAYGVTDESFALNMTRFRSGGWGRKQALTVNHVSNAAWVVSTVVGGYGGSFIPQRAFGIDYALIAMLLCLLVFQLRDRLHVLVAILSGASAVLISLVISGNAHVMIASVVGATLGLLIRGKTSHRAEGTK